MPRWNQEYTRNPSKATEVKKIMRITAIAYPMLGPGFANEIASRTNPALFVVTPTAKRSWDNAIDNSDQVLRVTPTMIVVTSKKTNWTLPKIGPRILVDQT